MGSKTVMRVYKSYNFVDKDPAIDIVRTMIQKAEQSYQQIEDKGGPSKSTLYAWFDGKTRRPQFCTLVAAARAIGGDVYFVNPEGTMLTLRSSNDKKTRNQG